MFSSSSKSLIGSSPSGGSDLYLMMTDDKYRYCLYRVSDPPLVLANVSGEAGVRNLGEPVLSLDKSTFPDGMNFAAIGSRIYMIGGTVSNEDNTNCVSNKVFIYDTMSSKSNMNSGKQIPCVFTLGSKLFALSYLLNPDDLDYYYFDPKPCFEMLDTSDPRSSWVALPDPTFSKVLDSYAVVAFAAVYVDNSQCKGIIFISVGKGGTYAFDVDKRVWDWVSDEKLPFSGYAVSIPHKPSLCCAHSLKSNRFSAFRFQYGDSGFRVDEILIEDSYRLSPLWPRLVCNRPLRTTFGPNGRVYFVLTGVDKLPSHDSSGAKRYVKVYALHQDETNKVEWLKRCESEKREMMHDESHDETIEVKRELKRCKRTKSKSRKRHEVQEERKEIKLTNLWESCFCGGSVCDELIHVAAAFAM